jgi:hypothetical protein
MNEGQNMKYLWTLALSAAAFWGLSALAATTGGKGKKADPRDTKEKKTMGTTDPKGVPLELRLQAKTAKYTLDLGGLKGDEFRKMLKEAKKTGKVPPPPAVDLTLELRNTGKKDLVIHVEGDANTVTLHLKGPGAVSAEPLLAFTADFRVPKTITLPAGKRFAFPAIKSLSHGFRGQSLKSYWTEAGDYTLSASYTTAVSPAPKGAKKAEEGFGQVTVTSAPVKIKVVAK